MLPRVASPELSGSAVAGATARTSISIDEPRLSGERNHWDTTSSTANNDEDWKEMVSLSTPDDRARTMGTRKTPAVVRKSIFDSRYDGGGVGGVLTRRASPLMKNKNKLLLTSSTQQQNQRRNRQSGISRRIRGCNKLKPTQRKLEQRPRHRTEAENDLFTSFTLNRDPQNSKYLPYDEVVYPKLFNRPKETQRPPPSLPKAASCPAPANVRPRVVENTSATRESTSAQPGGGDEGKKTLANVAAAELDSMWVVGFLEDARRNQKDLLLRDLRDFVRLPGSTLMPGAHAALDTINLIQKPTSFNSSSPNTRAEEVFAEDREGVSSGHNDNSAESVVGTRRNERRIGTNALTDLECLRLRELQKRLSQESLGVKDEDVRHHAGVQAYAAANRKLRKILDGARPPAMGPAIKSEGLEAVFRRNREERAAATRIQRLFKHYFRRKRFNQMILQLQGVVKIQALARGVIARRFVAEWYVNRCVMVLAWQNIIRRMLSNIQWGRRLALEQKAAAKIQAAERGRAGRLKARSVRVNVAALRIQCLWRGSVDRARVDRIWLGVLATRIQGLARVMVAKRVVGRKRHISNAAARSIQRSFRGTVARKVMVKMIWARSMERRLDFLRVLAAEEEWERENIEITQRRSRRMMLEEKLKGAVEAEAVAHAAVFELESHEKELKTQRMMLSPRALQQGWKEELDSNIRQHKEWITKRKLEAIFGAGLPARELEGEIQRRDRLLSERRRHAARIARWRDTEMNEMFDRESRKRFDDQHLKNRQKVADEKRRWAVYHFTPSGKPDKLKTRRRSRPWEATQDRTEEVLKEVATGGAVDLFAYDRSPEEALEQLRRTKGPTRGGGCGGDEVDGCGKARDDGLSKSGTLEQVMARLQLQSHMNQVAQFEEMMGSANDIVHSVGIQPLLTKDQDRRDTAAAPAAACGVTATATTHSSIGLSLRDDIFSGRDEEDAAATAATTGQEKGGGQEPLSSWDDSPLAGSSPPPSPRSATTTSKEDRFSARVELAWATEEDTPRARHAAAGFPNRHGAASTTPSGPPPPVGTGGTPVPIDWGEEERIKTRQRQRKLHVLALDGREIATPVNGEGGEGAGAKDSKSKSRVPWLLLDELEAEKQKLMLSKVVLR